MGRSFPSRSDGGNPLVGFLRKWIELSLVYLSDVMFYLHSCPPLREGNWSHCSDYVFGLYGRGEILFWLSLDSLSWCREVGRGSSVFSWVMVLKFFNRSLITLKFGRRKIERESQERESESESEDDQASCYFTLVSCYFTLVSLAFYTRKLSFLRS